MQGPPPAARSWPGPHAFGKEPRAIPGVKLFAIFKGPIVVVANEIPHLDFPQADFGDIVSVYHHVFQGTGVAQPQGPQDAEEEDEAAGGHGAGAAEGSAGEAERWGQRRRCSAPAWDGIWDFCTRVRAWRLGLASHAPSASRPVASPGRFPPAGSSGAGGSSRHSKLPRQESFWLGFFWRGGSSFCKEKASESSGEANPRSRRSRPPSSGPSAATLLPAASAPAVAPQLGALLLGPGRPAQSTQRAHSLHSKQAVY